MNERVVYLYWEDENWGKRGYAKNLYLAVDCVNLRFNMFESSVIPFATVNYMKGVKAARKSDLADYAYFLEAAGYTKSEEVFEL